MLLKLSQIRVNQNDEIADQTDISMKNLTVICKIADFCINLHKKKAEICKIADFCINSHKKKQKSAKSQIIA